MTTLGALLRKLMMWQKGANGITAGSRGPYEGSLAGLWASPISARCQGLDPTPGPGLIFTKREIHKQASCEPPDSAGLQLSRGLERQCPQSQCRGHLHPPGA